jgi:hypothetical protein
MQQTKSLILTDREIEKIFNVRTHYNHQTIKQGQLGSPAILSATVSEYWMNKQGPREVFTVAEMKKKIFAYLQHKGFISPEIKFPAIHIEAEHRWGAYDDDGYAPSEYSHTVEITVRSETVRLEEAE